LAENLDLKDVLEGRLKATLETGGGGKDYASIVRSLKGSGQLDLSDGRIGRLDVLGVLSKATGVFGEQSLNRLSSKLEKEGTDFDRFSGNLSLRAGHLESRDLSLKSPDLDLSGTLSMDLLAATLKSRIRIVFSQELSESMRSEGSRAASLFWNDRQGRVILPVELSGPLTAPVPGINWGEATHQLVARKGREKLRSRLPGRLGQLLGGRSPQAAPEPPPAAASQPSAAAPSSGQAASPLPVTSTPGAAPADSLAAAGTSATPPQPAAGDAPDSSSPPVDLAAVITRIHWSGSILMRNLKISGTLTGTHLDHAKLTLTDARGQTMEKVDRLPELDRYFAAGADPAASATIPWNITIKGKRLLGGKPPFTLKVTVVNTTGAEVSTTQEIRK
ncbi:MAG: AsmA-like C-terminal region-containing protein, partial [Acidobacteriota bacterium]